MYLIQQVTDNALQKRTLVLQNGLSFSLTLYHRPMQYGWFIESLVYSTLTLQGLRIVNSPNILHQFRNQLPFGLACFSKANREPTQIGDFATGQSSLYLLTPDETATYAAYLAGGSF